MTTSQASVHLTVTDRDALGKQARDRAPLEAHAGWQPPPGRPDPVALLEAQNATREPDLVPVRHGRMMASAFTFFRGSAAIMAADLATTPTAGLDAQLCGDAHLSNFGVYASPERQLLFDLNDFDETLPGPFEFDVKRLAASFAIAGRHNGFASSDVREACLTVTHAYRTAMAGFAQQDTLDIWYARLSEHDVRQGMEDVRRTVVESGRHPKDPKGRDKAKTHARTQIRTGSRAEIKKEAALIRRGEAALEKARTRTNLQALAKLTEVVDGRLRIVSQPPVLIPMRELEKLLRPGCGGGGGGGAGALRALQTDGQPAAASLLDRYRIVDVARKVVGVGSVGTRAFVALLEGRDARDPLFLQVKEATRSVLEAHLPRSAFANMGERVVQGQSCSSRPRTSSSAGPAASRRTATTTGGSCAT